MFRKGFRIVSRQWRYKSETASMRDSRDNFKTCQPTREYERSTRTHGPVWSSKTTDKQTPLSTKRGLSKVGYLSLELIPIYNRMSLTIGSHHALVYDVWVFPSTAQLQIDRLCVSAKYPHDHPIDRTFHTLPHSCTYTAAAAAGRR